MKDARVASLRKTLEGLTYVAYRRRLAGSPNERDRAARTLHAEIDEAKTDAL